MVTSATRAVPKRLEYYLLAAVPGRQRRQWLYLRVHRELPDLRNPSTFSEKVNWRILHDRRPELAWTCDKLRMKEHAGAAGADVVISPTLWRGVDVTQLADVDLPEHWVLKPSHRSGLVYFGNRQTDLDVLNRRTRRWLVDVQHGVLAEWAYGQADPCLFVEDLIGEPGNPPPDFKFFVFDGVPVMIQVDIDRFSGHRRSLFGPDWRRLPVALAVPEAGDVRRPPLLPEMLDAAATLAKGFDFMRIDLYADEQSVFFGEFTPYPGSGLERFIPRSFDGWLGAHWRLPASPPS